MAERFRPPYKSGVNYWLLATDPDRYGYSHLEKDAATVWKRVTDYEALKTLRDVEPGEEAFIYHAGTEHAIVGIARFTSEPYPNPEGSSPDEVVVDIVPVRRLERPVYLTELEDLPEFQDFDLVDDPDLGAMPVSPEIWNRILELSESVLALTAPEEPE
jgi:predicted RNA-binding protein with PUA-like domain